MLYQGPVARALTLSCQEQTNEILTSCCTPRFIFTVLLFLTLKHVLPRKVSMQSISRAGQKAAWVECPPTLCLIASTSAEQKVFPGSSLSAIKSEMSPLNRGWCVNCTQDAYAQTPRYEPRWSITLSAPFSLSLSFCCLRLTYAPRA